MRAMNRPSGSEHRVEPSRGRLDPVRRIPRMPAFAEERSRRVVEKALMDFPRRRVWPD
ncbi:MAG: hypothetical protein ACP5DC_01195 [Halothiobacillaceae bacterium]